MNTSKIFILIAVAALVLNYTKASSPEMESIRSPVQEEISAPARELEEIKLVEIKKIKDEIKTIAEGEIMRYQEESFYSEDDFSVILENEDEFKSQLIEKFKEGIIGVIAENCQANLNQSKKSAILKCDIKGARYGTNSYNMHFLLNSTKRFGFDLYGFKEIGKKFIYDGEINNIPTKIIFEFPYEFCHCHEHAWPK